jgi:hypothetical protein
MKIKIKIRSGGTIHGMKMRERKGKREEKRKGKEP